MPRRQTSAAPNRASTRGMGHMTIEAGHPYGSARLGIPLIGVSFLVLAFLGVSSPAVASPPSVGSTPARTIIAEARAAMIKAGSVSAAGSGTTTVPGVGRATLTETDYSAADSGSQVATLTSGKPASADLPSATTLDVGGAVYVNGDASFWTATVGMGTMQATQVAGHWVQIPKGSPAYSPAAADLTMSSLVHDLFHAKNYRKGTIQTVDGTRVIAIAYVNTGDDSGPVTCYVAVGSHLPVEVTIGGLSLHLGSWGKARAVSTPSGAIPLPALGSSSASALPVVA